MSGAGVWRSPLPLHNTYIYVNLPESSHFHPIAYVDNNFGFGAFCMVCALSVLIVYASSILYTLRTHTPICPCVYCTFGWNVWMCRLVGRFGEASISQLAIFIRFVSFFTILSLSLSFSPSCHVSFIHCSISLTTHFVVLKVLHLKVFPFSSLDCAAMCAMFITSTYYYSTYAYNFRDLIRCRAVDGN